MVCALLPHPLQPCRPCSCTAAAAAAAAANLCHPAVAVAIGRLDWRAAAAAATAATAAAIVGNGTVGQRMQCRRPCRRRAAASSRRHHLPAAIGRASSRFGGCGGGSGSSRLPSTRRRLQQLFLRPRELAPGARAAGEHLACRGQSQVEGPGAISMAFEPGGGMGWGGQGARSLRPRGRLLRCLHRHSPLAAPTRSTSAAPHSPPQPRPQPRHSTGDTGPPTKHRPTATTTTSHQPPTVPAATTSRRHRSAHRSRRWRWRSTVVAN